MGRNEEMMSERLNDGTLVWQSGHDAKDKGHPFVSLHRHSRRITDERIGDLFANTPS